MDIDLIRSAEQFHNRRRRNRVWKRLVSILGCVVVFCTTYALILPAITMEQETVCGLQEHQHTDSCYTRQTAKRPACTTQTIGVHTHTAQCADGSCGYADFVIHEHNSACYEDGRLVCTLPERKAHTHTTECYQIPTRVVGEHTHTDSCLTLQRGALTCGKAETEGHTHTEACYGQKQVLICTVPESDGHTHGEGCYDESGALICTEEESTGHHHGAECYQTEKALTCGLKEAQPHHHTDECYAWENQLTCGKEAGPIYEQGQPELICTKEEIKPHQHTSDCFDAAGNWICGQPEILSHTHTNACFEPVTEDVLTCGQEEHTHSEECCEAEGATGVSESIETEPHDPAEEDTAANVGEGIASTDVSSSYSLTRVTAFADEGSSGSQAVDLSAFVVSVSVQKLVNNQWVSSAEFKDGDNVRVYINYMISEGVVGENSRIVTYQVPANVRPIQEESGRVSVGEGANAQEVGDYTITTDGLITITFDESFANNEAFVGSIYFQGEIDAGKNGEGGSITFPGTSNTIEIEQKQEESGNAHDVSVKKTGTLNEDKTISYTIEVSTQNGTKDGQKITIGDIFENYNGAVMGAYTQDSVTVKKVSAANIETTLTAGTDYTLTFGTQNNQNNFAITELGELEAGGKYVVTYTAAAQTENADGSAKLNNHGYAQTEDYSDQSHTWVDTEISKAWIHKEGWNDAERNVINWTITLNPSGNNLAGWTLTDVLTAGGQSEDLSNVAFTILDSSGQPLQDANSNAVTSLPYTFPAGTENKKTYTITYSTPTGVFANGTTLSNTASITKGDKTYSDVQNVVVKHREWQLSKSSANQGSDQGGGIRQYEWNANVTIPGGELTSFTYVDTIQDPVSSIGGTPQPGKHYGIASRIEAALRDSLYLEMEDGTKTTYPAGENANVAITVGYYSDVDRTVPVDSTDDTTPVRAFAITVTPKENATVTNAKKLIIGKYPTQADHTGMKTGETWTLGNTGQVDTLTSTAEVSYTKPKPLEKYVLGKDQHGNSGYVANSTTLQYDDLGGKIKYRLVWRNLDGTNDAVTITDTLPAGMRLSGEVTAGFYANDSYTWYQKTDYSTNTTYNLAGAQKPVYATQGNEDGTTTLTITIPAQHNLDNKNDPIVIFYEVAFDWPSLAQDSVLFTNRAQFGDYTAEQSTTVERNIPILSKSGRQLTTVVDGVEKPNDTVEYTVVINPGAKDLDANSDTLLLTDQLTVPNGVQAYLDMDQVFLYNYADTASNKCGAEISTQRYQISYDQQNLQFTVRLPDELACVLVYRYVIDEGDTASVALNNTAGLNGETSGISNMEFKVTNSGATVLKRGKVTVSKVDSEDYTKGLPGAVFQVDWFNPDSTAVDKWEPVVRSESSNLSTDGKYTTGTDGEILFFQGSGTALPVGKLIRLTEVTPPVGYAKDSTPRYFVIYPNTQNLSEVKEAIRGTIEEAGISQDLIAYYKTGTDVTIYVPNESTSIQVQKIWLDENNHQMTTGMPEEVTVQLYRQPMVQQYYTVTVSSAWRSTSGGYYCASTQNVNVDVGSPLTITELSNDSTDEQTYTVSIGNGTPLSMQFQSGKYVYTVPSVNSDLSIEITNYKDGARMEFTLSGYRAPSWVADGERTAVGESVTLNSGNDWSHTWYNLPQVEGEAFYVVEEIGVPSGYSVTYTNNGIKKGAITISNRKQKPEYTLPETGGGGTARYTFGGFLLTSGAALWLFCRRKRRREAV